MGQKVNPNGMRLGINKTWNSFWYADKKDIAKNLEKIIAELEDETAGPLFYGGELPEEDKEILKGILEQALVVAKIKNKARYTPKKYRQDND